jgi:putative sterol carrier protein
MEKSEITFDNAVNFLKNKLTPAVLGQINEVFTFNFKDTQQTYLIDGSSAEGKGWIEGTAASHNLSSEFEVTITKQDFARLVFGDLNPMAGMVTGKMKIKGSIKEALKLDRILKES